MASLLELQFHTSPEVIYCAQDAYSAGASGSPEGFPNSNFLKGAKWSPDGACCLTASEDHWLRVYDLPPDALTAPMHGASSSGAPVGDSWAPGLGVHEGETVYDYAWWPCMQASEPASCCFATTSRAHPVHLWDACTGQLRATYRAYDAVDEVTPAVSVAFSPDGMSVWAGYNRTIHAWDVGRPGRDYSTIVTHKKRQDGQPGLISCIAFSPDGGLMAAGAYSGVAALYDPRSLEMLLALSGHTGGITQVMFSKDGNFLYTGARRDRSIHCWDVRMSQDVVYSLRRDTPSTNQRIAFDIEPCGRHLATGGESGAVEVFDLRDGTLVSTHPVAEDTVNGCSFHPCLPLAAVASGQRRFPLDLDEADPLMIKARRSLHATPNADGLLRIDKAQLQIGTVLGTGGFAKVEKALWNGKWVAYKTPEAEDAQDIQDAWDVLAEEAQISAELPDHPHITPVLGCTLHECHPPRVHGIVMELLEGNSLAVAML
ncbi:hypothetical protein WJX84_007684 [Apatococcus fuscideae]|uniref:Protein kinase domain-containing protein n=1 Tax=Apatococcus fuscideae TaxID=2026836 RepID=A0AAW1SW22_9CHLO